MNGNNANQKNGIEMRALMIIALVSVLLAARPSNAQEDAIAAAVETESAGMSEGDPAPPAVPESSASSSDGFALSAETAAASDETDGSSEAKKPADEKKDDGDLVGALKKAPGFAIDASLAAMWMLRDEYEQPTNEFRVNRARVEMSWTQWKLIEAAVGLEAKELVTGNGGAGILRDMYIRVQPLRQLGLRVGQFKKPFSRVELTGRGRFPLIKRGIANSFISDQLLFGGRDIGAMLEGRLVESVKLDYAVGVFNGLGSNTTEIGFEGTKDVAARVEMEPVSWLDLGVNGSLKFIEKTDLTGFVNDANFDKVVEDEYPLGYSATDFRNEYEWMTGMSWMTGLDVVVKPDKLRVVAEGSIGENWWFEKYPYVWSATLVASYKFKLVKGVPVWLEPAIRGEVLTFLTDGMSQWRARLWTVAPGVNLHVGKHVRLMVDGEFQFAQGTEADIDGTRRDGLWPNEYAGNWNDSQKLMVQLGFNL